MRSSEPRRFRRLAGGERERESSRRERRRGGGDRELDEDRCLCPRGGGEPSSEYDDDRRRRLDNGERSL